MGLGRMCWMLERALGPEKRRQQKKGGFPTKAEAELALAEAIVRGEASTYNYDDRITVAAYLDRWLTDKTASVRATTIKEYRRHVEVHLSPSLGHLRLRELRTRHVSKLLVDLADDHDGRGLGVTTVRRVHATLRSALSDACRNELVSTNVAAKATVPRLTKAKVNPWQPRELGAFLDYIAADKFAPIYGLMAMAGLRRGEATGLRWFDLDLSEAFLVVRQQVVQLDGHVHQCALCGDQHVGILFSAPKTSSGEALRVDLSSSVIGHLLAHRLSQDEEKAAWRSAYHDHDLVFAMEDGNPLHPERLTKRFNRLVATSGLRKVRLHDLRHGRASLLLGSGMDIALVSKIMGHSSITLTADTYSHLLAGAGRRAAEAADALIPRAPRDQVVTSAVLEGPADLPSADSSRALMRCRSGASAPRGLPAGAGSVHGSR
jgi:integrase